MYTEPIVETKPLDALGRLCLMAGITGLAGWASNYFGIATTHLSQVSVCTFVAVICTALLFWSYRVAVAFLGASLLIGTHAMTLRSLLNSTELEIILFLIGMMILGTVASAQA